jgi:hypothetical protein
MEGERLQVWAGCRERERKLVGRGKQMSGQTCGKGEVARGVNLEGRGRLLMGAE